MATINELRELINSNNHYFRNREFKNYFEFLSKAKQHFLSVTVDCDDQQAYFEMFGLDLGEVYVDDHRVEKYFVDEVNATVSVRYYEAYIDSGVNKENYFYGYLLDW